MLHVIASDGGGPNSDRYEYSIRYTLFGVSV